MRKLSSAILSIQAHNASSLSFEEHYRHAYALVLAKKGDVLHKGVSDLVQQHLLRQVKEKIDGVMRELNEVGGTRTAGGSAERGEEWGKTKAGERFLKVVREVWDDHLATMKKLRDVLKYMVSRSVLLIVGHCWKDEARTACTIFSVLLWV
ncbi:hypothetical protein BT69DRAFT_1254275 [Atractiella rhizophila]|nr:hypothetical protein BT69DRAFT_1254275 [Atractiella rhizophila]